MDYKTSKKKIKATIIIWCRKGLQKANHKFPDIKMSGGKTPTAL